MGENVTAEPELKKCFVVCPIGAAGSATRAHADWLLHEIIEHVFERHFPNTFEVVRADRIDEPGMIDAQIINHLLDDDLVIADMSELNANAFYEIGIRHMIEKPIIHMFKAGTEIPFDVKLFRAIQFAYAHPVDLQTARTSLSAAVRTVMATDHKPDNPVVRARGFVQLQETATPAIELLQQEISALKLKVSDLEGGRATASKTFGEDMISIIARKLSAGKYQVEVHFTHGLPDSSKKTMLQAMRDGYFDRLIVRPKSITFEGDRMYMSFDDRPIDRDLIGLRDLILDKYIPF